MDQDKFYAMMTLIVPQVVNLIAENFLLSENEALKEFHGAKVYFRALEDGDTKFWHLSLLMLFTLFDEEKKTGHITFWEKA